MNDTAAQKRTPDVFELNSPVIQKLCDSKSATSIAARSRPNSGHSHCLNALNRNFNIQTKNKQPAYK